MDKTCWLFYFGSKEELEVKIRSKHWSHQKWRLDRHVDVWSRGTRIFKSILLIFRHLNSWDIHERDKSRLLDLEILDAIVKDQEVTEREEDLTEL